MDAFLRSQFLYLYFMDAFLLSQFLNLYFMDAFCVPSFQPIFYGCFIVFTVTQVTSDKHTVFLAALLRDTRLTDPAVLKHCATRLQVTLIYIGTSRHFAHFSNFIVGSVWLLHYGLETDEQGQAMLLYCWILWSHI